MIQNVKRMIEKTLGVLELGYKIAHGIDYRTLSQYILKINQHKDVNGVLLEVSRCLKDILDYELFGFALKSAAGLDIWIDPKAFTTSFKDHVLHEFESQNIDHTVHYFETNNSIGSHNVDILKISKLISYDLKDKNYTARLYILPRRKMLSYHDRILNTIIASISIALEKNLNIKQLENAAAIDPLTNCYNRRALNSFIESDIAYARRSGTDLSVVMIDLDNFKKVNDTHGHQAGDAVLKSIALLLPLLIRKSDYLARYGGEEFVLVLPDTSLYNAVQLAGKIRKRIAQNEIDLNSGSITVTASFGVASLENKLDTGDLFREADARLYKAKAYGRNLVVPSLLPCFADPNFTSKSLSAEYTSAVPAA